MAGHPELDLKQQIAHVRRFGESPALVVVAVVSACTCVAAIVAFNLVDGTFARGLLLLAGGVAGILAIAIATNLGRFRRAARATRAGRRVHGTLDLVVDRSDPDHVVVTGAMEDGVATWVLRFGTPLGWKPQSGAWPCQLVFLSDQRVPALAQLPDGLLFPTGESRRIHGRGA